jgi:hypothetical protein
VNRSKVLAQLRGAVGGIADITGQRRAEPGGVAGRPAGEELQQFGELGSVTGVQPDIGLWGLPPSGWASQGVFVA